MKKLFSATFGLFILFSIFYFSKFFLKQLHILFPAGLLGLIIFSILLFFNVIKESWIEDICNILVKNISLFFIPFFVGIISFSSMIGKNLIPILTTVFISTFVTIILTGIFVDNAIKYTRFFKLKKGKTNND